MLDAPDQEINEGTEQDYGLYEDESRAAEAGPDASLSRNVHARLKWFNQPKGFGFVVLDDDKADAFLHVTTLQRAGIALIGEGAYLLCEIEAGAKGSHVKKILELIDGGKLPESLPANAVRADGFGEENHNGGEMHIGSTQTMTGRVKWYKVDKGFGFIMPDDGMKDVFIHQSCLDKMNIAFLEPDQKVSMVFRNVPKGREVVSLKIIG